MTSITIRRLKATDAERVALLVRQLTNNIVKPDELISRIQAMSISSRSHWLVADKDGLAVGCGGLVAYMIGSKGVVGTIEEVVVDAAWRGHGIGKKIMEELLIIGKSMGLSQVKLTAKPEAVKLYQELGFIENGDDSMVLKWY